MIPVVQISMESTLEFLVEYLAQYELSLVSLTILRVVYLWRGAGDNVSTSRLSSCVHL